MKIAFISYEYPPDRAIGGIATYVYQAACMLRKRGHHIEVFASSPVRSESEHQNGVLVHWLREDNDESFSESAGKLFMERHARVKYDVLEGPEYKALARRAVELVPDIPLIVKLHTPSFIVNQLNYIRPSLSMKVRRYLGALRRGKRPKPFVSKRYVADSDLERIHALDADEIAAPSRAIGKMLSKAWNLETKKLAMFPYPFIPSQEILNIPVETDTKVVSFVGRLEIRKGVLDLANAIPTILRESPKTEFRFVGQSLPSPIPHLDMKQYLERSLSRYRSSVEFMDPVSLAKVPSLLAETDICVFPSRWENFPYVCLEAMAAGRGIVASSAGGMGEMLDGGTCGKLVPPGDPRAIAVAVLELLDDPDHRMKFGQLARKQVMEKYSPEEIGPLQEASYLRAIQRRRMLCRRRKIA